MLEFKTPNGTLFSARIGAIDKVQHINEFQSGITIDGEYIIVGKSYDQVMAILNGESPEIQKLLKFYHWLVRLSFENGYRNGFNDSADQIEASWEASWLTSQAKERLDAQ